MERKNAYDREVGTSVANLVADAFEEIKTLRDEIQGVRSNLEEKFSNTRRYPDLETAESSLDNVVSNGAPEIPEKFDFPAKFVWRERRRPSRRSRLDLAVRRLDLAQSTLEGHRDTAENIDADDVRSLNELINALDEAKSNADSVEFPEMFG